MKLLSIALTTAVFHTSIGAESTGHQAPAGAIRAMVASADFPFEQYGDYTPAQIRAEVPEAIATVRESCSSFHVDFNKDGLVDCILSVSLRARNSHFFVLERLRKGWRIVGQFHGNDFSFLHFAGSAYATLETALHPGGSPLVITTYTFRDGQYREARKREEPFR